MYVTFECRLYLTNTYALDASKGNAKGNISRSVNLTNALLVPRTIMLRESFHIIVVSPSIQS